MQLKIKPAFCVVLLITFFGCKKDVVDNRYFDGTSLNKELAIENLEKGKISSSNSEDDPNEIDDSECPFCEGGGGTNAYFNIDGTVAYGSLTSENFFKVSFNVKKNETTGFYEVSTFNIVKDPNTIGFPFTLTTVWKDTNPTLNGMILTFQVKKMITSQYNTTYYLYDGTITIDFINKTIITSW